MNNKYTLFIFLLLFSLATNAQTWTFDNMSLNDWTTHRLNASYAADYVILETNGQSNPRFEHATAAVNATLNKYAVVKMRVGAGGPSLLRINFDGGFKSVPVTTGGTDFISYTIDMTDTDWSGTENEIELAFKDDDGSNGGATHNSNGIAIEIEEISFVENIFSGVTAFYVDLNNGNDNNIGSSELPLKTIPHALDLAAANNVTNVYIKAGTYNFTSSINITTAATNPVVLSPEPNENVTLNLSNFRNFRFYDGAKNIEVKGFELNGNSNTLDHWTLLSEYVWLPSTLPNSLAGGGVAFNVEDAEDIKITDNVIHDFYQKAVNIEDGRYLKIKGNIIYNIGQTSLSGGHGIMRQQGSGSFTDNDDSSKYRWDIDGNLIFNVHQRIYSWVPSKGYLNMTLDEGKPILIDETPDHDTGMKARIINNIVAFSKIDAVRLKPTNNLEVSNNSIYTKDSHADGITNTTNGFNSSVYGEPFLNFKCTNNAVEVFASKDTYSLDDAMNSTGSTSSNNYGAFGGISPVSVASSQSSALFTNPDAGDFNLINTSLSNVGVNSSTIADLNSRVSSFNVNIANDNWEHDHLKNTQTLLDNIPGVEDGVTDNEPVFLDPGTYAASDLEYDKGSKAYYFTLNSTWEAANIDPTDNVLDRRTELDAYDDMYELIVPGDYRDWYEDIRATYLRDTDNDEIGDTPYSRIRYGASILAQDKVFTDTTLHVVEIESSSIYTVTEGDGVDVTLDGDILVDIAYTPTGNEVFDLIAANEITGSFDNVTIQGYSGAYTLSVVPAPNNFAGNSGAINKVLRLALTSALPVELVSFDAIPLNGKVDLKWQTANEINNDYFTVERSKDGLNWEELTQIAGAGNSSRPINYSAVDINPFMGLSYYRLKQTDFDGRMEYSAMKVVNIEKYQDLILFPNPSTKNQEFNLLMSDIDLSDMNVTLYNNLGQQIGLIQNDNSFRPVNKLSKVVYFVKVQSNSKTFVLKWEVN